MKPIRHPGKAGFVLIVGFGHLVQFCHNAHIPPPNKRSQSPKIQRRDLAVNRLDVREILGTKTMREITLK
jgi:hypothetical protein